MVLHYVCVYIECVFLGMTRQAKMKKTQKRRQKQNDIIESKNDVVWFDGLWAANRVECIDVFITKLYAFNRYYKIYMHIMCAAAVAGRLPSELRGENKHRQAGRQAERGTGIVAVAVCSAMYIKTTATQCLYPAARTRIKYGIWIARCTYKSYTIYIYKYSEKDRAYCMVCYLYIWMRHCSAEILRYYYGFNIILFLFQTVDFNSDSCLE